MRAALGLAAAGLLAGGLVALAPTSASAAWTTVSTVHDAQLQVCRTTLGDDPAVKFRIDNRRADHTHVGLLSRRRDGTTQTFRVRAPAGEVSGAKKIVVRSGDRLGGGIQDPNGAGAGGGVDRGSLSRC